MRRHHMMHPYTRRHTGREERVSEQETTAQAPVQEEEKPEAQADNQPSQEEAQTSEQAPAQDPEKELADERLRMAAEMENFKKRLRREHEEQMRYASEKVLADLLPALDNLDLAIQYGSRDEACRDMMQGIEMTRKQLLEAVAKSGLTSVGEPGEAFDPAIHEAIGVEAHPEFEPGAVSKVLQRGYKLNDRLMRPAKVMVNNS